MPTYGKGQHGAGPRSSPGTILMPQRVLVNPPGRKPYFTTKYKKVFSSTPVGTHNIHVIQSGSWHGDRGAIIEAWTRFVGAQPEERRQGLTLPIVAMQEIYYQGHKGLFAVLGNRIVGVVSYKNIGSDEIDVSIMSPSPYDIVHNRVESITYMLGQAIKMQAKKRGRHLTHSDKAMAPAISALSKWVEKQSKLSVQERLHGFTIDDKTGKVVFPKTPVAPGSSLAPGPAPGPPPREGLKWKPTTHRWVRSHDGAEFSHEGERLDREEQVKPSPNVDRNTAWNEAQESLSKILFSNASPWLQSIGKSAFDQYEKAGFSPISVQWFSDYEDDPGYADGGGFSTDAEGSWDDDKQVGTVLVSEDLYGEDPSPEVISVARHELGHVYAEKFLDGVRLVDVNDHGWPDQYSDFAAAAGEADWETLLDSSLVGEHNYKDEPTEALAEVISQLILNPKRFKKVAPTLYEETVKITAPMRTNRVERST